MAAPSSGYRPYAARIAEVREESHDTRTFVLDAEEGWEVLASARPGQFVMLSVPGFGEAAFTISGLRAGPAGAIEVTVRRVGSLTTALFALEPGDRIGLRGPFGRGFRLRPDEGAVYVAGGCGLSPLKWAIERHVAERADGAPIAVIYGVRTPDDRIHRSALAAWRATPSVRLFECSEASSPQWRGLSGNAVAHVPAAVAKVGARHAVVCGPPKMMWHASRALRVAGIAPASIELALERTMKCGTGHCGHCYVDAKYVCRDGPVFTLAQLDAMPEAFGALLGDATP